MPHRLDVADGVVVGMRGLGGESRLCEFESLLVAVAVAQDGPVIEVEVARVFGGSWGSQVLLLAHYLLSESPSPNDHLTSERSILLLSSSS